MAAGAAYREVMRDYEADRANAANVAAEKRLALYAAAPGIEEIDRRLAAAGPEFLRALTATADAQAVIDGYRAETGRLRAERERLVKSAGFPADYDEVERICASCGDTGFINGERCSCMEQRLINKHYGMSELGDVIRRENFDSFKIEYYSTATDPKVGISPRDNIRIAYDECVSFVSNFGGECVNLLFYGEPGLGKTFLCNCVAKDLLDAGRVVLYATAPRLFKKVADSYFERDGGAPDPYVSLIYSCDLLIIDDLGAEVVSSVTASELFNFINSRHLAGKPVIISTNLSPQELAEIYSERITSRLVGNFKIIRFFGDDIREIKKYT